MRRRFCAAAALIALPLAMPASAQQLLETCAACHGAHGVSTMAETPSLAGQPAFFVLAQLVLFREGRRDNPVMNAIAKPLTNDDLRALAIAYEKLPPPPASVSPDAASLRADAHWRKRTIAADVTVGITLEARTFRASRTSARIISSKRSTITKADGAWATATRRWRKPSRNSCLPSSRTSPTISHICPRNRSVGGARSAADLPL